MKERFRVEILDSKTKVKTTFYAKAVECNINNFYRPVYHPDHVEYMDVGNEVKFNANDVRFETSFKTSKKKSKKRKSKNGK